MTVNSTNKLSSLGAGLLAASALATPSLSFASFPPDAAAPFVITMNTDTQPATEFSKLRKLLQPLKLTAEQHAAVKSAIDSLKTEANNLHERIKANKQQLNAQRFADSYDAKSTEMLASDQGALVKKMILLRTQLDREVYKVLSPEQRVQLKSAIAEKQQRKTSRAAGVIETQARTG